jgi:molybdopterin-guanine dinucleotide biosynthesis protein A
MTNNLSTIQNTQCLGVILAGGLSSRMGQDKSKLTHAGTNISMLNHSKQLLENSGIEHVVISGNVSGCEYQQIPDVIPQAGPVGGIYSVLSKFTNAIQPQGLLILPVDLPFMTVKALTELRIKGELSQKATFFKDTQGSNHHIPLYLPNSAYLTLFLAKIFQDNIFQDNMLNNKKNIKAKNGPSVRSMLEQIPSQAISCSNNKTLFNTNTPQEWQQAAKQF